MNSDKAIAVLSLAISALAAMNSEVHASIAWFFVFLMAVRNLE